MSRRRLVAALLFFVAGAGAILALEPLADYVYSEFRAAEPYLRAPIEPLTERTLRIRSDINGKGRFGASRHKGRTHQGIDLLSAVGDPVFASKSGRVTESGWQKGYGGYIKILHPDGLLTVYAHLSRSYVSAGEWLAAGTMIGRAGKSGNAYQPETLPHLHFEVRQNGKPVNPASGFLDQSLKIA